MSSAENASLLVREYRESDLDSLRAMHAAQGFAYEFPDLGNPLFVSKVVLAARRGDGWDRERAGETSEEQILGAALLRLTAEAYLLLDPREGSPRDRMCHLLALQSAVAQDAWRKGLDDVHAWLPPRIAKQFGRRLERLGWLRDDAWTPYCRRLPGPAAP